MDRRTQLILSKIGRSIPKDLLKRGMTNEQSLGAFERDLVAQLLKDPRVSLAEKKMLRRAIEELHGVNEKGGNIADQTKQATDPKVGATIDKIVGAKVAREIRSGRIKKADQNDPFLRKMRAKSKYAR